MNITSMINKYDIKLMGENIAVTAPKENKNMEELMWIKEHKAEIIEELKNREAEKERIEKARAAAFIELKKTNPEMKRNNRLTEKAISRVVNDKWSIEGAVSEYRSLYADVMDSHF